MEPLDFRGLPCPDPVVRTKKAIEANPNAVLTILTDQASQRDNIARMAKSLGASVQSDPLPNGDFRLTVTTGVPRSTSPTVPGSCATVGLSDRAGFGVPPESRLGKPAVAREPPVAQPAPATEPCAAPPRARAAVFVRNDVVGHGDPQLGRILMKAFLKTLKNLDPLPSTVLFINAGVHLTTEGSEDIAAIAELEKLGIEIMSCGTCLDFYKKLDKVRVGIVGNMFDIVDRLNRAPKVIVP